VALDVPDTNAGSLGLVTQLGLTACFETARMYTGPTPDVDLPGIYATTTLELG
jgi:hypothetical protein